MIIYNNRYPDGLDIGAVKPGRRGNRGGGIRAETPGNVRYKNKSAVKKERKKNDRNQRGSKANP